MAKPFTKWLPIKPERSTVLPQAMTVMNNDGVKVSDDVALNKDGLKAGDVNLTKAGLNNGGNKITNVAAGTDDTDAVNVSQLKQAAGCV